jgi:hypothetical protein
MRMTELLALKTGMGQSKAHISRRYKSKGEKS